MVWLNAGRICDIVLCHGDPLLVRQALISLVAHPASVHHAASSSLNKLHLVPIRVFLSRAGRTDGVGALTFGVALKIFFDLMPLPLVVPNLLTRGTNRQE